MFHGNKKKEKKILTEEEVAKIEVSLSKLKEIQKNILDMRNNENDPTPTDKKLDTILKASMLMPDFSTLWTYRKELIQGLRKTMGEHSTEFYGFLQAEIKAIMPIMMKNTKSYVLWYHR